MAFMVTAFREVISRVLAPVALVAATVLFFAGNVYAAQLSGIDVAGEKQNSSGDQCNRRQHT